MTPPHLFNVILHHLIPAGNHHPLIKFAHGSSSTCQLYSFTRVRVAPGLEYPLQVPQLSYSGDAGWALHGWGTWTGSHGIVLIRTKV